MTIKSEANRQLMSACPTHISLDALRTGSDLIGSVAEDKYFRHANDQSTVDVFRRTAKAICGWDEAWFGELACQAMCEGYFMPGGRILAGAGTKNRVTLMNCYVCVDIKDSLDAIADALKVAMLTQQQGGGIGMDFSDLRPEGATLQLTGAEASGPMPFMDMWDAMCRTIMSAGTRRGAMMGVMSVDHPDILKFITSKREADRLRMFNVSVLVSDAFMDAVEEDAMWHLHFPEKPSADGTMIDPQGNKVPQKSFTDDDGTTRYVYRILPARQLWDTIMRNTYDYAEPGVIFIDRINDLNNLKYCEHIHCTNPCGEQPLPANGTCNLGAINLGRFVRNPYSSASEFNYKALTHVVQLAVRFLDNVIEVTRYPTKEQKKEEFNKRRVGLGIAGLADAMAFMGMKYGSAESIKFARSTMRTIALEAYKASSNLAVERDSFPLYDPNLFFNGFAGQQLPTDTMAQIHKQGIRNGVLLTIAPTGTTSIFYGNISAGLEPVYKHVAKRAVLQKDGTNKEYTEYGYAARLWREVTGDKELPDYMISSEADNIAPHDHVRIQAAVQEWVDASVSKTINCAEDLSFEEFQDIYTFAYDKGCKGCTTYRESDVRGKVLSGVDETPQARPDVLPGKSYKVRWPSWESAIYVTINDHGGNPFEVFIQSKDARFQEWTIALSVMMSLLLKLDVPAHEIAEELRQIQSTHDSHFVGKKRYGSLLARIGEIISYHEAEGSKKLADEQKEDPPTVKGGALMGLCPKCLQPALVMQEGCETCTSCGYSKCG